MSYPQQPYDQQPLTGTQMMYPSTTSSFDPNAVPFLIQCLKNCISTRNSQQSGLNLASGAYSMGNSAYSSLKNRLSGQQQQPGMYGGGEDVITRGNVAKQALTYLASMSPEELGSITITGQSLTSASLGATRAWNAAPNISGRLGPGLSTMRSNMGNAMTNTRKQMSSWFGNRGVGGKRKYRTRKHRKHHK